MVACGCRIFITATATAATIRSSGARTPRIIAAGSSRSQVSGRSASGGLLDLTHFERQQAKVRFNVNF